MNGIVEVEVEVKAKAKVAESFQLRLLLPVQLPHRRSGIDRGIASSTTQGRSHGPDAFTHEDNNFPGRRK